MLRKQTSTHAAKTFLAALGAFMALVATTPAAHAGQYAVPFCKYSSSGSTASWEHSTTAGGTPYFFDSIGCQSYGGFIYRRFEVWSVPAGASDDWTFNAPDGTYISRLDMSQDSLPRSAGAMNAIYAWQQDGSRSTLAASRPGTTLGSNTYNFPVAGSKVVKLRNSLLCQDGANCPGTAPDGAYGNEEYWHGARVYLVDPSLPAFASVAGDGWTATPVDGDRTVSYDVTDSGAGVKELRFYVDGVLRTTRPVGCNMEARVPCPASATGSFSYDTTRLSEGQHDLKIVAVDGSLNEDAKTLAITVRRPPQPGGSAGSTPVSTSNPGHSGGGAPAVGDQLQGSPGSWSGSDLSFAYQWMRCDADGTNCVPIAGATNTTYSVTSSDLGHALQLCVTASNSGGSTTRCSVPTPAVIASHPSTTSNAGIADRPGEPTTVTPAAAAPAQPGASDTAGRGTPNGTPAADKVVLTALVNNRASTKKVKYGKRVSIGGRLLAPNGTPIAGAIIAVQTKTALPGASMADAAQVVTGKDGKFAYLAPVGPSRVVRFGYRSHSGDTSFADTTDVTLKVSAGVTMRATRKKVKNRKATIFTGRVLGKPIPRRGVVVDLQVYFRKQWRNFAAPRTNRRGVYRFKYRFMAGAATWRFRARVRRDGSYPYEVGMTTKKVQVKVVN
jgi:hypothetical protein